MKRRRVILTDLTCQEGGRRKNEGKHSNQGEKVLTRIARGYSLWKGAKRKREGGNGGSSSDQIEEGREGLSGSYQSTTQEGRSS